MEFYQDWMEGVVKSLRCSAAKHRVCNKSNIPVMVQQEAISKQWAFPLNVLYHCSPDIRVARVVYGSTGQLDGGTGLVRPSLRVRLQTKSVDFHDAKNRQRPCRMFMHHVKDPNCPCLGWVLSAI
ncbi:hypothetical protein TNCV_2066711 [Trichonephila clavipes]|uniref:Uncharacterized protein n=1 Tax=Trichonephila clavipes TaxID=2585209 RepID=A0A8X6W2G9_TRICX|nr:hypothetical protein TNCV_2066711 [Trichonephila clavipes]